MNGSRLVAASRRLFGVVAISSARAEIRIGVAAPLTGPICLGRRADAGRRGQGGGGPERPRRRPRPNRHHGAGRRLLRSGPGDRAAQQARGRRRTLRGGPQCSGAAIPASKVYEASRDHLDLAVGDQSSADRRGLRYIFRTGGRDDLQGAMAGDTSPRNGGTPISPIVHDGQAYGQGIAEEVKRRLDELGIRDTCSSRYSPARPITLTCSERSSGAIEVSVSTAAISPEAGLIVRQAKARSPSSASKWCRDRMASGEFGLVAGDGAEGTP